MQAAHLRVAGHGMAARAVDLLHDRAGCGVPQAEAAVLAGISAARWPEPVRASTKACGHSRAWSAAAGRPAVAGIMRHGRGSQPPTGDDHDRVDIPDAVLRQAHGIYGDQATPCRGRRVFPFQPG
jgi:hypothetical protein